MRIQLNAHIFALPTTDSETFLEAMVGLTRDMTGAALREYFEGEPDLAALRECSFKGAGVDGNVLLGSVDMIGAVPAALTPYIESEDVGALGKLAQRIKVFLKTEEAAAALTTTKVKDAAREERRRKVAAAAAAEPRRSNESVALAFQAAGASAAVTDLEHAAKKKERFIKDGHTFKVSPHTAPALLCKHHRFFLHCEPHLTHALHPPPVGVHPHALDAAALHLLPQQPGGRAQVDGRERQEQRAHLEEAEEGQGRGCKAAVPPAEDPHPRQLLKGFL